MSGVMPGPASLTEGAHGPNRDWGSIGRTPLHSTIAPRLERPCQVAGCRRARRSGAVRRRGLLQPRSPCPGALPPADRPRRDRDRGLRGAGAPARTHHGPVHAAGVPRRGGAPPRGAPRAQRSWRCVQPPVAVRPHPGARAPPPGGGRPGPTPPAPRGGARGPRGGGGPPAGAPPRPTFVSGSTADGGATPASRSSSASSGRWPSARW